MEINAAQSPSQTAIAAKPIDRPWRIRDDNSNTLEAQSRKFVAQFFFGTLLKQMRSSSMGTGIFDGGAGGKSFQGMLDQRMAEGMSNTPAGRKIAENLARSIQKNQRDNSLPNSLEEARRQKKISPRSVRKELNTQAADQARRAAPSLDMKG